MKMSKKFLKDKGLKDTLYNVNYNPNQNRGIPQEQWIKGGLSELLDEYANDGNNGFLLEDVYSGIGLKTRDGEFMGICMRDTGFEFNYQDEWYEAKNGVVRKLGRSTGEIKLNSEEPSQSNGLKTF